MIFQILLCISVVPLISGYNGFPPQEHRQYNFHSKPYPPLTQLPENPHRELTSIHEAQSLEFSFPSECERLAALADGRYNPNKVIPIDVDVYSPTDGQPQIFVTIPRFDRGSPYTLARVVNSKGTNGMKLEAYPNYSWHSSYGADCDGLTSVYRIKIDECSRMWILDSGEIGRYHTCPPQVVVIDMPTQTVVSRYRLPENVYTRNVSRLVTITVDVADPPSRGGQCHKAFAYIADPTAFSIIVYDAANQQSWRVENKYTYPDPQFSTHVIAGDSFQLLDGVFGLSVTPDGLRLPRMLYFHSLSHDLQVSVPLDVINNSSNFNQGLSSRLDQFTELGHRGVHCSVSEMTPQGYLMCGFFQPIALVGWDICTPYSAKNWVIMAENSETLQFIGGLKISPNKNGKQEVWMLSNRAQKFFSGTTNFDEINYRVLKCGLDELLLGKPCVP